MCLCLCLCHKKRIFCHGEIRHTTMRKKKKTSSRCSASDKKTHQRFLSPHQLFDLIAPAEQVSEPPYRDLQVSELHVVSSAQWDLLKRPNSMPVQEETRNGGTHRVYQAGTRLDLKHIQVFDEGFAFFFVDTTLYISFLQVMHMEIFRRCTCRDVPMMISRSALGKSLV